MAEFVGSFASSHGPLIAREWEAFEPGVRARLATPFGLLGERIRAAAPDFLVIVSPDHWTNFFLDNLPSVCIGLGDEHAGPPEPFMRDFARTIAGVPAFATHLLETALAGGFEPSVSHHLALDHGFCIPLKFSGVGPLPVVPIVINDLEPPMPSIARCFQWGRLLASAIDSYPAPARIAVLATGGLSHSIGESTMGEIDEDFDRACIAAFTDGAEQPLVETLERALRSTGNGAHEVRNWVVAHAAAGAHGFELLAYEPLPEVYVGCAWAAWRK